MNRLLISVIVPWFLTGALALVMATIVITIPRLIRTFFTLPKTICVLFILTTVFGTLIRFLWVPNTHRIYFDEDRYLMYAVSFAKTGRALGIQIATPNEVLAGDPDPGARVTVPLIHAWVMKFFGYSDRNLFITAKTLSSIEILLVFIVVYLIFGQSIASLLSAFGMAFIPIMVYWSTTTNLDSIFVFFALLTTIAAAWYAKKRSVISTLFFLSSLALLLFVRIEGMLLLPSIIWTVISLRKHAGLHVITRQDLPLIGMFLPVFLTRIIVALPLFTQTWCCAEATPLEIFQIGYFWRNTIPNLQTLFLQKEFPFMITTLSIIAIFKGASFRKNYAQYHNKIWIFTIWILIYFFLYSFYYVGIFYSYTFSGSYGRFFLMLVPPFLVLSSLVVDYGYTKFIAASHKGKTHLLAIGVIMLLSLYPTILSYRTLINYSPWDHLVDEGPRLMRAFLTEDLLPNTPQNALIIHPLTGVILMSGRSVVSIEAFVFQQRAIDFVKQELSSGVPVYMLATDVCEATPYKCRLIGDTFIYTPLSMQDQHIPGFSAYTVTLNTKL